MRGAVAKHAHMQIKPPCPGATHREYISKAEHVSVACININVKNAGCLFLKANVEVEKHGESGNLNCKKKKTKLATQLRVFHASSCATSTNYMFIEMHFFFLTMEDKIRVSMITSSE